MSSFLVYFETKTNKKNILSKILWKKFRIRRFKIQENMSWACYSIKCKVEDSDLPHTHILEYKWKYILKLSHLYRYIFYNSKPEASFVITTVCLFTKWTWASWVIIQLITSHAYQICLFMDLTLGSVWLWSLWIWN